MSNYRWVFFVPGTPIAQPRARATAIGGHARMYTPTKHIKKWKYEIQLAARQQWHGEPMQGPFSVELLFTFPRSQAITWKTKPMPALWHVNKPDRDNLDKAVLDSLTGIFWKDDCQVCDGRIMKRTASGKQPEGVLVAITHMRDMEIMSDVPY